MMLFAFALLAGATAAGPSEFPIHVG